MKRITLAILSVAFMLGSVSTALAVEIKASGQFRVSQGWYSLKAEGDDAMQTDSMHTKQRLQTFFDFIANENLKAVLGLRVGDTVWGHDDNAIWNKAVGGGKGTKERIQVKHAYLDFNIPNTQINVRAGLQDVATPGALGSLVFDDDATALMLNIPVNDMVGVTFGWLRLEDKDEGVWDNTTQTNDDVDTFLLMVPVTADGFSVTPYALYSLIGKNTNGAGNGLHGTDDSTMWHLGLNFEVSMLDPVVIMGDLVYGYNNRKNDPGADFKQSGWMVDLVVDYKMDFMTPEVLFWYMSGEGTKTDKSSIMPAFDRSFAPSSFGFDDSAFGESNLFENVSGIADASAGLGFKLKDMTFMDGLSHTLTALFAVGTSDKDAGITFDSEDSLFEIDFDTKYQIYDELAAYVELGYVHINWKDDHDADLKSAYKAAFGLVYDF